ncbi:uncharacterized protein LOC114324602 isoform X2 [Diabrotica virgifera virgifera]|uniref:Uncharacterized protein LOC114324602 isoform X2 n=1 Tax=Diabrotica virgifera virgifera TaxID=50390 RepID=A0A6P7EYF5_DIAVI|nr:uncharacterized protein LOC114324602 isoform X2 [Diabrotica virgifera virgifera]
MGNIIGILIALVYIACNQEIFKKSPSDPPGPLVSTYLFLLALFILLCELQVYPASLRKLGTIPQVVLEVFLATFIAEIIIVDFWFPLESIAMDNLIHIADLFEELLSSGKWNCDVVCDMLRSHSARYSVSYAISTFFLFTVLHATRFIDIRTLDGGISCFFGDILGRSKRRIKKQFKNISNRNIKDIDRKSTRDISEINDKTITQELKKVSCPCDNGAKHQSVKKSSPRKLRRSKRLRRLNDFAEDSQDSDEIKFDTLMSDYDLFKKYNFEPINI